MKTYIWTGPKRLIPKIGTVEKGQSITLNAYDAKNFLRQGFIKSMTKPKKFKEK